MLLFVKCAHSANKVQKKNDLKNQNNSCFSTLTKFDCSYYTGAVES